MKCFTLRSFCYAASVAESNSQRGENHTILQSDSCEHCQRSFPSLPALDYHIKFNCRAAKEHRVRLADRANDPLEKMKQLAQGDFTTFSDYVNKNNIDPYNTYAEHVWEFSMADAISSLSSFSLPSSVTAALDKALSPSHGGQESNPPLAVDERCVSSHERTIRGYRKHATNYSVPIETSPHWEAKSIEEALTLQRRSRRPAATITLSEYMEQQSNRENVDANQAEMPESQSSPLASDEAAKSNNSSPILNVKSPIYNLTSPLWQLLSPSPKSKAYHLVSLSPNRKTLPRPRTISGSPRVRPERRATTRSVGTMTVIEQTGLATVTPTPESSVVGSSDVAKTKSVRKKRRLEGLTESSIKQKLKRRSAVENIKPPLQSISSQMNTRASAISRRAPTRKENAIYRCNVCFSTGLIKKTFQRVRKLNGFGHKCEVCQIMCCTRLQLRNHVCLMH